MRRTSIWHQARRFVVVGGSNTAITFVLLAILAHYISHSVAYSIVFLLGAIYTAILSGRYVFATKAPAKRTAAFLGWYFGVYLVGLGVIHLVDLHGHRSAVAVAFATVVVTAPLSFLGGRLIFYHRPLASTYPEPGESR